MQLGLLPANELTNSTAYPKRDGLGRCSQEGLAEGALLPLLRPLGDSTLPDLALPLGENSLPGGAELLCCPCSTLTFVIIFITGLPATGYLLGVS